MGEIIGLAIVLVFILFYAIITDSEFEQPTAVTIILAGLVTIAIFVGISNSYRVERNSYILKCYENNITINDEHDYVVKDYLVSQYREKINKK